MKKIIWLVIPCYNEQEVLPETSRQLEEIMRGLIKKDKISDKSKIAFVNDGSKDNTWNIITDLHEKNPMFTGINLAHNKGHQNALLAGLMTAKDYADAAISLDADLQDDVGVIEQFIDKFNEGKDVVYGVRSTRATDTVFKRSTAHAFYKLMKAMGADTLQDHADYRLMSKRALEGLAKYKEVNLFLRGIVPMIGYETDVVYYERHERFAGESKYPLKKMLSFAVDGITSCSVKPIRMITSLGTLVFTISIVMLIYFLIVWLLGHTVQGWTTIVISLWGIGGLILLSLGIITEPITWLKNEAYLMPIIIVVQLWQSMGVSFLANISGLQNINRDLYEAGSIDGVRNRWQELRYITLPSMSHMLLFSAVMQIQSSFSISAVAVELAGYPSVQYSVDTIVTHMSDMATVRYELGYASAIAVVLFAMMAFTRLIIGKALNTVSR